MDTVMSGWLVGYDDANHYQKQLEMRMGVDIDRDSA